MTEAVPMTWKPTTWKDVYPGQDWRSPEGELVHVGAVMWDGYERTALCLEADGGVLHCPATLLIDSFDFVGSK